MQQKTADIAYKAAAMLTGLAGICYAFGFMIHAMYLGTFGVVPGEIISARYVYSGAWFLFFLALNVFLAFHCYRIVRAQDLRLSFLHCVAYPVALVLSSMITIAFTWFLTLFFPDRQLVTLHFSGSDSVSSSLWGLPMVAGLVVMVCFVVWLVTRPSLDTVRQVAVNFLARAIVTAVFIIGSLVAMGLFNIFTTVPVRLLMMMYLFSAGVQFFVRRFLEDVWIEPSLSADGHKAASATLGTLLLVVVVIFYALMIYPILPVATGGAQMDNVGVAVSCPDLSQTLGQYEEIYLVDASSNFVVLVLKAEDQQRIVQLSTDQVQAIYSRSLTDVR